MHLCCKRALAQTHTPTVHTHTHTHHTHPLIVTDRAERAALSHHDESLTRKKNGGRETERADRREEELRDDDKQVQARTLGRRGFSDVSQRCLFGLLSYLIHPEVKK